MSERPQRRRAWIFGGAAAVVVGLVLAPLVISPVDVPTDLPLPTTTTPSAPTTVAPATSPDQCGGRDPADPTKSLRPSGPATPDVPGGSYMATIKANGRLRVGVSPTTLLFSSVNPETGVFEGFDDDIAREVGRALFGEDGHVEFVAIPQTDRVDALKEGRVDMVASTFSINCTRLQDIQFSSEYFTAGQKMLVPRELAPTPDAAAALTLADLAQRAGLKADEQAKVCAANGSTSIGVLDDQAVDLDVVAAASHTECLAKLQRGEINAVSTDDTILAGMAAQDPTVTVAGAKITTEHYGLGLPPGQDDWVRYVNAVLEGVRSSGRWGQIYDQWLLGPLTPTTPAPPPAAYSD
jgi:polar amino acid transport system substrate-binding protein